MNKIIVFLSLVLFSCHSTKSDNAISVTVITDGTDGVPTLKPSHTSILKVFDLDQDKNRAAAFRLIKVKDQVLSEPIQIDLPGSNSDVYFGSASLGREHDIVRFYENVQSVIDSANRSIDTALLSHSYFLQTLARELESIERSSARQSIILAYSNGFENSDKLNVYNQQFKATIFNDPAKIIRQIDATRVIPSITKHVQIVFVYIPKNAKQERLFLQLLEHVYKPFFKDKGINVSLLTSNSFNNF